jgi:hypothetical protein
VTAPQRRFRPQSDAVGALPHRKDYGDGVRQPSSLKAPATVTSGRGFMVAMLVEPRSRKTLLGVARISLPIERGTTSARRSSTGVLGRHIRRRSGPGRLTGWKLHSGIAGRSARSGRSSRNCEGLDFLPTSGAPYFTRKVWSLGSLFRPNPAMAGAGCEFHGQPANI